MDRGSKYDSVLQLSKSLIPLNSCSYEKAMGHHEKGRGILTNNPFSSIEHDHLLVFNFEPKKISNAPYWFRTQMVNRTFCWICGVKDNLTHHHVIPKLYRKNADPNKGLHSHQWLAIVCRDCHNKAEKLNLELFNGMHARDLVTFCNKKVQEFGGWEAFQKKCAELWYQNKPIYNPRGFFRVDPFSA